jgi:hypothetical protein
MNGIAESRVHLGDDQEAADSSGKSLSSRPRPGQPLLGTEHQLPICIDDLRNTAFEFQTRVLIC